MDSAPLHIAVEGHGPPLVLLHGWALHSGIFANLREHLSASHCLYSVDLPGHGRSRGTARLEANAFVDALIERVPDQAIWLGWSLGGLLALHAAMRHRPRLAGLVMVASSPRFTRAPDWPYGVDEAVFRAFAEGLEQRFVATIEGFLDLETRGSAITPAAMSALRNDAFQYGAPEADQLLAGLELLQHRDLRDALATLNLPSVWIAGRRDRMVRTQAMQWAAHRGRRARYLELDSGHMPFLSHPEVVAEAVHELTRA